MEPHAPKGQRTLFDVGCTKWKHFSDEQPGSLDPGPRELRIRLDPDIACRVEEQKKQQVAAIAAQPPPPPPRPVGRPRKLPVVEAP